MTPEEIAKVTEEWEAEQEDAAFRRTVATLRASGGTVHTLREPERIYSVASQFLSYSAPKRPNPLIPLAVDAWVAAWRYLKMGAAITVVMIVLMIVVPR